MILDGTIDTHCHLGEYADPVATVKAAESAGMSIVAVTEEPGEFRRLKTRLGDRTHVDVALGLHPLRAVGFTPYDMARFFRLLPQAFWIGEVGLDFSALGVDSKRQQLNTFEAVLSEAQPGRHPLSVHSRGAEDAVISRLAEARLPAVLHWYSGPSKLIDDALDAGLYFSVNPAMTRSKKIVKFLQAVPNNRVLLETDGPYVKDAAGPVRPDQLASVIQFLSAAWSMEPASVTSTLRDNQVGLLQSTRSTS